MTLDIEKIKYAAMAATQGEWKMVRSIPEEGFECFWLMHNDAHFGDIHGPQSGQQLADAEHIVTANPQAVLELITRLEAAEADRNEFQKVITAIGNAAVGYDFSGGLAEYVKAAFARLKEAELERDAMKGEWEKADEFAMIRQHKLEAAEKDAARYRWLRDSGLIYLREGLDDSGWCPSYDTDIDDAADEAIASVKESEK